MLRNVFTNWFGFTNFQYRLLTINDIVPIYLRYRGGAVPVSGGRFKNKGSIRAGRRRGFRRKFSPSRLVDTCVGHVTWKKNITRLIYVRAGTFMGVGGGWGKRYLEVKK